MINTHQERQTLFVHLQPKCTDAPGTQEPLALKRLSTTFPLLVPGRLAVACVPGQPPTTPLGDPTILGSVLEQVGTNHSTCFRGFLSHPGSEKLRDKLCFYHIDAPGQSADDPVSRMNASRNIFA